MSEQYGDKTEAATPKRRQQARERGQVARSVDLTAAVVILGTLVLLNWTGQGIIVALQGVMTHWLGSGALHRTEAPTITEVAGNLLFPVMMAMAPVLGGVVVAAVIINLLQVGFILNTQRLQPDLASLSPAKGIKKLFGGGRGPMQLVMNLVKLLVVSAVAYSAIHGRIGQIVSAQTRDFGQIFLFGSAMVYDIGLRIALLLLVLSILDYAWQKFSFERDLRMTKQEVKDEMKSMEGDPMIKQRRRQIQMQRATQRARQAVPGADVVVTNPTEFAIALKYDPQNMHAPRVVAKGQGYVAQRIREVAIQHGIPIIQRPPLARALYKLVEVGGEIPEQFYSAVAEILAYVYQLTGRRASREPAGVA
jgi:flagellar biosynthetic protein FlhB